MKIVIDGYEDLVMPEGDETLGQLLVELEKWIKDNKRVIVQIRLEGKPLSKKEKEALLQKKVSEFKVLELFTANPWQWAISSLSQMREYLPEIAMDMEKVSLLIQKGDYKKAFSLLDSCINLWNWVNENLEKIEKTFALDYTQILFKRGRLIDKIREFLELIEETNRALKNSDFLTVADILEYELAPRIREEQEIVGEIAELLKQQMN